MLLLVYNHIMSEEKLSLNEAINYLKKGERVYTFFKGLKTYLHLRKTADTFTLKNENLSLVISLSDLLLQFKENHFYLDYQNEEFIDPFKDEEYYSWKQ